MKKIFLSLISVIVLSCTPRYFSYESEKGDTMLKTMNGKYSNEQFDSMCVADTLPRSILSWKYIDFKDYETNEKIGIYFFIKERGKTESVYKVEKINNDSVKIIKRIIVE